MLYHFNLPQQLEEMIPFKKDITKISTNTMDNCSLLNTDLGNLNDSGLIL